MAAQERTALFDDDDDDSFVRRARRAQLVEVAIATIAEVGLAAASTVVIARRARTSRGVLTYHFRDRQDLLDAVVEQVYAVAREELAGAVAGAPDAAAALRTFVAGSIAFYVRHPDHMVALSEIYTAGRRTGAGRDDRADHRRELDDVGRLLLAGQDAGVFRVCDVPLLTACLRAVLDVALARVRTGDDPALLTGELLATVDAMTAVTS